MTWQIIDPIVGNQPIADVSTVKRHPLGLIVNASDPTYGVGEFIYVKGVASGAQYDWVAYYPDDWSTVRTVATTIGQIGILQAALVASTFGWAQISGKGVGKVLASFADNGDVYLTATAGSVDDAVVDGYLVHQCRGASAIDTPSTGLAEMELARPYTDGIAGND
jgi:hypothetical protein